MSRRRQKGFTLLEVLVCVAILSSALVLLYRPMLGALNAWRYGEEREEAVRLLDQQIWQFRETLRHHPGVIAPAETKTVLGHSRAYEYRRIAKPAAGDTEHLYEIECQMSWMRAGIAKRLVRNFYAYVPSTPER